MTQKRTYDEWFNKNLNWIYDFKNDNLSKNKTI
jgi:hypothetical protein